MLFELYLLEVGRAEPPRLFWIIHGAAAVDCTGVGHVLIFSKSESDVIQDAINLCVEFYSKKGHKLY